MMRAKMLCPAAALALASVTATACGAGGGVPASFSPQPGVASHAAPLPPGALTSAAQVRAWMKTHPVPARKGKTAGVVGPGGSFWPVHCPATGRGSRGEPGTCAAWQVRLVTASGTLTVTCGSPSEACTSSAYPAQGNPLSTAPADDHDIPLPGDYLYAPAGGQVSRASDVQVIRRDAVPLPGGA